LRKLLAIPPNPTLSLYTDLLALVEVHPHLCHFEILIVIVQAGAAFDPLFELPKLKDEVYAVRYDARGHGRSGKPLTEEAFESIHYAEDFEAVVEAFGLSKPFYAGWSLAG
jgi:hypothetical protein